MAVNALPYYCFGALQTLSIHSRRLNGIFHTLRISNFPQLFHLSYRAIIKEDFVKPRPPYCGRGHPPFKLSYKYNPASCISCNFLFSIALISVNENQWLNWCMACFSHCAFFNMLFIAICFKLFLSNPSVVPDRQQKTRSVCTDRVICRWSVFTSLTDIPDPVFAHFSRLVLRIETHLLKAIAAP